MDTLIRSDRRRAAATVLARRLGTAIPLLLIISLAVFALAAASPFDPLDAYLTDQGDALTEAQRAALRERLGLDVSWFQSWWNWLGQLASGHLGQSRSYQQPVSQVLAERLPWTVLLGVAGGIVAVGLSFGLGAWAGLHRGRRVDRALCAAAITLQAVPPFVLALGGLLVFALTLRLLPVSGLTDPGEPITVSSTVRHLTLPAVVLGISQVPWLLLGLRESLSTSMTGDAIRGARARGLSPWCIATRHVLPVSVAPFITLCGARLPELVIGATLVETIFSWPGAGSALIKSAQTLDFPLLAILTLVTAGVVLLGNAAADAVVILIDPRVPADG